MSSTEIIRLIFMGIAAYFIGNINPAIIIGKLKGIDIRKEGSGNAGMTNTIRVMGLKAGITVFVVDVLKAFIAVKIGFAIAGMYGAMAGFAGVVIGHCWPAAFGFKGGKGVAASLGAALARRMSVASLAAALSYPLLIWRFDRGYVYFAVCAAAFLMIMHMANIKRIAKGEEKPLTIGGGNKSDESDEKEQTK